MSSQIKLTEGNGKAQSASRLPLVATVAVLGLLALGVLLYALLPGSKGAEYFYGRGLAYYKEHNYYDAKHWFSRAIEANPKFEEAYFQRAIAHQRLGEIDDAIIDYTSYLQLKPDDWSAVYNRGLAYRSRGDREQALADFTEAGRLKPDDSSSYLRRIEIYRAAGDFEHALSVQSSLIDRFDHNFDYRYARAALRREIGDLDGAMRDLDAIIAITDERTTDPYLERGRLRRETGDTAGALADFEQTIARKPDDLRAYLERGQTYRDMGQVDAARAEFDEAIKRKANLATGYFYRGVTRLFTIGDAAGAAEDLSVAVDRGFEFATAQRLGRIGIQSAQRQFGIPETPSDREGDSLAPGVPFRPSIYYVIIWRHIARLRAQQDDAAEFEKATRRLEIELWREGRNTPPLLLSDRATRTNWPGEILALFTGQATPELVRRAAEAAPGSYVRRLRLCEVEFYIAEYALTKNERAEARTLLQAAVASCPASAPETAFAKSELARLVASGQN